MSRSVFELSLLILGAAFAVFFTAVVVPPLLNSGDVLGAFAAGFVNPYSAGYSMDVIVCAFILTIWALYEREQLGIRHGWIVVPLSLLPGVAVAFAAYLVLRSRQLGTRLSNDG